MARPIQPKPQGRIHFSVEVERILLVDDDTLLPISQSGIVHALFVLEEEDLALLQTIENHARARLYPTDQPGLGLRLYGTFGLPSNLFLSNRFIQFLELPGAERAGVVPSRRDFTDRMGIEVRQDALK